MTTSSFVAIAPAVCEQLLGDPMHRGHNEHRWGRRGSFRLRLESGTWQDFENAESGGVIELVKREMNLDKAGALAWLEDQGFLSRRDNAGGFRTYLRKSNPTESPYSPKIEGSTIMTPKRRRMDALSWIRSQILPITDSPDHPIRNWMAKRNLWRPELPLPPSLRWTPADAPVFRGSHSGIGAIAFPLATISAWRAAYPETPSPAAVQLVCIDAEGEKADYANSQRNRVDKPKFGNARLAVWTIGDIRGESVSVCEGAADALALAAREPNPVTATLSTPRPVLDWEKQLSAFDLVTLWPDMDEEDEQGRRPGLDAALALAKARQLAGQTIEIMGVDIGKDAADAAREAPFAKIDHNELTSFAQDLAGEGATRFEAIRYASTILK